MSENERASGKRRNLRDLRKEREDAMKQATPSTPPQDDPPPAQTASPEVTNEPDPQTAEPVSTPEPSKPTETEPTKEEQKPSLDVDYKQQYRTLSESHKKLQAAHDTLKGMHNKEVAENKKLKQQLESGDVKPSTPLAESVRETEAFKKVQNDWDDETAENFVKLAEHMLQGVQPAPTEPAAPEPAPTPASEPDDPFFVTLDNRLPGWDVKYNDNPEFVTWARQNFEPLSGKTYQEILEESQMTSDVEAALRIFSAFDRSVVSQNTDTSPDMYIEPSNTGGAGTTQPEAPTFDANYLEEQEKLMRKGKISREEFYNRRKEFMTAHQEGRVTA